MSALPKISLNQQVLGIIEAARTQARADQAEHRRGKMRLSAVEYRQSVLTAAHSTLALLDRERERLPLVPAQIELFRSWQAEAKRLAEIEASGDEALIGIAASEYIAIARLLRNFAALALRADLAS